MFRKTGTDRVNSIVSKLLALRDDLLLGVDEIDLTLSDNKQIQDALKAENTVLGASRGQAVSLANNIEELLT